MRDEIEIKFPVAAPRALRARLRRLGFRVAAARRRERNWLFEAPKGRVLRLRRRGGTWLLTAKGTRQPGALKRRAEAQTEVADGLACRQLLLLAGHRPSRYYQLWRTLYRRPGERGDIAWDETAAGRFIEIEGTAAWVRRTAAALGFELAAAEPRSYPEILAP